MTRGYPVPCGESWQPDRHYWLLHSLVWSFSLVKSTGYVNQLNFTAKHFRPNYTWKTILTIFGKRQQKFLVTAAISLAVNDGYLIFLIAQKSSGVGWFRRESVKTSRPNLILAWGYIVTLADGDSGDGRWNTAWAEFSKSTLLQTTRPELFRELCWPTTTTTESTKRPSTASEKRTDRWPVVKRKWWNRCDICQLQSYLLFLPLSTVTLLILTLQFLWFGKAYLLELKDQISQERNLKFRRVVKRN